MRDFLRKGKTRYKAVIIFLMLFASSASYAYQEDCNDPLNPNPDFPDCDPDIYVPIDDGVYFILIAGILIGYKLLNQKKTSLSQTN